MSRSEKVRKDSDHKYNTSDKGRERMKRYRESLKGITARWKAEIKHEAARRGTR